MLRGTVGNSEGSRPNSGVDPVTTDPKGEAHKPPVRNTPALTPVIDGPGKQGATMEAFFAERRSCD